jgi:hypothetical protein
MRGVRIGGLFLAGAMAASLAGCARGGGSGPGLPSWIIEFIVRFAGPIDDTCFYYVAIDADNDFGVDGPLPVAAGPYWGNGWGTGSMTHFVSYHQGRYDVFRADRQLVMLALGGGILSATGSPDATDTGEYRLTVGDLTLGAAAVSGAGTITAVTNDSDQNAGQFSNETDAAGKTVARQVSFTPATDGGRTPNAAEQAALDALNAGADLAADSLSAFGLTLTNGPATAGVQIIDIAPSVAGVSVRLEPTSGGQVRTFTGTLTANSSTPTATPPIPGASLQAQTLVTGGVARFLSEIAPTSTLLGPPYDSQPPLGSSTLDATIDLDTLGQSIDNLSVNFIATTELIFDPTVTNASLHCYDALGAAGNDYVTFSVRQTRTISNGYYSAAETGGDQTLAPNGPFTQQQRDSVDIIDWQIVIQRLSG